MKQWMTLGSVLFASLFASAATQAADQCTVAMTFSAEFPQVNKDTGPFPIDAAAVNSGDEPFTSLPGLLKEKGYTLITSGKGKYSLDIATFCLKNIGSLTGSSECGGALILKRDNGTSTPDVVNQHSLDDYHIQQTYSLDLREASRKAVAKLISWISPCVQ